MNAPSNPTEIARETLKTLAHRKIPPTPGNYAKIYGEINGVPPQEEAGAEIVLGEIADQLTQSRKLAATNAALKQAIETKDWSQYLTKLKETLPKQQSESHQPWSHLIRDLLRQLDTTHKGWTIARKKEGLETVLSRFSAKPEALFEKLSTLIESWANSPIPDNLIITPDPFLPAHATNTTAEVVTQETPHTCAEPLARLSELLAQALESTLHAQPELTLEAQILIQQIRAIQAPEHIAALVKPLRQYWIKFDLRVSDKGRIHEGLVRLLRLLVENVGEMTESEEWLHGQIVTLQETISNPVDRRVIADAERSLRDTIIHQGLLKKSLSSAKATLKNLMTTFINRLNEITESTGDYGQKIQNYSQKIGTTNNLTELSHLLDDIMKDTSIIQASALRSHEELINTRQQVHHAENEIKTLQKELAQISELVREDQLTGALNRRGLDTAFENESNRADRRNSLLCVAMLDIDNFKHINDTLGHQVGDQALVHLGKVIKHTLRPSDSVARYGGEEFIILMPDADLDNAAATLERLQRELTKKYFLHENERVLVTFSAGVAQRTPHESQEEVISRADKAMYRAKKAGKNRVIKAP